MKKASIKRLSFSFLLLMVSSIVVGQVTEEKIKSVSDSVSAFLVKKSKEFRILEEHTDSMLMSNASFSKYFDKYFTYLSFDKQGIPEGNSATLKTSSNDTKLNLNLSYKRKGLIFSAGTDVNLSNGIAKVISGKDITGNTTFYFNFSALGTRNHFKYWKDTAKYLCKKRTGLYDEFDGENKNYSLKYLALLKRLKEINEIIKAERNKTDYDVQRINKLFEEKEHIEAIFEKSKLPGLAKAATKAITDSFETRQYELETKGTVWNALKIGWFSGGLSYTNEKLITYDGALQYNKRVADFLFDKWAVNLSYNYFHEYAPSFKFKFIKSFYLNLSYKGARDNNYSSIDEKMYSVTKQYVSNDSLFEIKEDKKVRDITGVKLKSNWSHTFGTQMTFILSKSNFWGINIAGSTTVSSFDEPLYNSKFGILFRFADAADEKSKVNFELFLQLNDLTDIKGSGKSAWDRKAIGLSATVPFSKIFFK